MANAPLVMSGAGAARYSCTGFGDSAVELHRVFLGRRLRTRAEARDEVRTNIWYTFRRHNIEIPWPIQIQYDRVEEPITTDRHISAAADHLASVDLFKTLASETRQALATASSHHLFAAGEAIVRQDAEGDSMFVLMKGQARVVLEPSGQEVAVIPAGGFFGEMSMLTGDHRTATVKALDDVMVLEIAAKDFRELALAQSGLSSITSRRSSSGGAPASRTPRRTRPPSLLPKPNTTSWRACAASSVSETYSAQMMTRPSPGRAVSTMMPGPCFSMSSTRNDTPRSSQPCW